MVREEEGEKTRDSPAPQTSRKLDQLGHFRPLTAQKRNCLPFGRDETSTPSHRLTESCVFSEQFCAQVGGMPALSTRSSCRQEEVMQRDGKPPTRTNNGGTIPFHCFSRASPALTDLFLSLSAPQSTPSAPFGLFFDQLELSPPSQAPPNPHIETEGGRAWRATQRNQFLKERCGYHFGLRDCPPWHQPTLQPAARNWRLQSRQRIREGGQHGRPAR